jgi:hypothetical protein
VCYRLGMLICEGGGWVGGGGLGGTCVLDYHYLRLTFALHDCSNLTQKVGLLKGA